MSVVRAGLVLLVLTLAPACGWFGPPSVPDATPVEAAHIGVRLQAPKSWTVQHQEKVGRTILYAKQTTNRDHAVIVQKLSGHKSWREHSDDFRDGQEHALDKIESEKDHEIGDGGVYFVTRQAREGHPVVRKLRYYIEIGDDTYLLDMAAPEADFSPAVYTAMARSLSPLAP